MRMLSNATLKALTGLSAALLIPTISAAPNGRCEVGETWRDWKDCHGFFECAAGGIPVRKVCGPGTAYSPHIGVCDYEWKVPTCHRSGHGKEGDRHGHGDDKKKDRQGHGGDDKKKDRQGHGGDDKQKDRQGHGGDDKKKGHEEHGNDRKKENNHGWKQGYKISANEEKQDEGKCHVGSAWPDKDDCRKFWECAAGGILVRKSCGPGTAYSPELGVCDYEWKVRSCRRHHNNDHGESSANDDNEKWEELGQNGDDEGDKISQHDESSRGDDH
ncbi:hypothetical protein ASPCAL02837 [Aspergillus calidoustus]|uniref:Chitin-binding type-2 domain-containing protein n=1 Tax=Aspergillus calidoustus TaxID=454130 RepID=A0A0U4ZWF1_ASPCI|nr:hypothetical protein ASPCAL02837 [Aspergillus calidoustus]